VTELKTRLVMLLIATVICAALVYHPGRDADREVVSAAFLRYSTGTNIIRLEGDVPSPGIYRVPENATLKAVINLTAPSMSDKVEEKELMGRVIKCGDIIDLTARDKQHIVIKIYKMTTKERILLGIPLHPDEMEMADWESLPGIGPALAKEIMDYRQNNGDFGDFVSLSRVPGLGEKKIRALKKYFQDP
jgi:competence protein ComEA